MTAGPPPATPARPGFARGAQSVFEALGLLARTPSLWPWAIVPLVVAALLESAFIALGVFWVRPWLVSLLPEATTDLGRVGVTALGWVAAVLVVVAGWIVAVALTPPLSSPALEKIVEHVERELGVPPRAPIGFFAELACGLRAMAGALLIGGPVLFVLWVTDIFVPPAAPFTVPLKIMVSSLFVAWGLFDYPLSLRGIGFRERLEIARRNLPCMLGFGAAFAAAFWLPCCGVLLLPAGVAAATRLIWEMEPQIRGAA